MGRAQSPKPETLRLQQQNVVHQARDIFNLSLEGQRQWKSGFVELASRTPLRGAWGPEHTVWIKAFNKVQRLVKGF